MTGEGAIPATVTLDRGDIRLTLSPQGAAILGLDKAGMSILRAARAGTLADPTASALFPMVPWCNRISSGLVEGRTSRPILAPNWPTTLYPVHGFGWLDPWEVENLSPSTVRLVHGRHEREGYSYTAALDIMLAPDGAEFRLSCTNAGPVDLPFGIGLHPFLPRESDSVLTVPGGTRITFDQRGLPEGERAVIGDEDFRGGRKLPHATFSALYPGCLEAVIAGFRSTVRLAARGDFRHILVWAPEGRDFVCIEPMSHRVDDFSTRASAAPHDLAPGATLSGVMTLRVQ